jgi:hypothetical protein
MSTQLSGDDLSRAVAKVMGWTIQDGRLGDDYDGRPAIRRFVRCRHPEFGIRDGLPRYAENPTLIGEMLGWLHIRGFISVDWSGPRVAADRQVGAYWHPWGHGIGDPGEECVTMSGATPSEALSRCVVEVGKMLSQEPKL